MKAMIDKETVLLLHMVLLLSSSIFYGLSQSKLCLLFRIFSEQVSVVVYIWGICKFILSKLPKSFMLSFYGSKIQKLKIKKYVF
jgi:hypothetical protein